MTPEQNLPQKCLHQDTQVVWGLGAPSVCGHHTQYQAKHPSSIPWQTWISQMFGKAGDVLQPQRESPLLVKSRWSSSHQGCMKHGGSGPYSQEAFAEFSDTNRDFLKGHGGVIWGTPCLIEGRAAPRDCKSFLEELEDRPSRSASAPELAWRPQWHAGFLCLISPFSRTVLCPASDPLPSSSGTDTRLYHSQCGHHMVKC